MSHRNLSNLSVSQVESRNDMSNSTPLNASNQKSQTSNLNSRRKSAFFRRATLASIEKNKNQMRLHKVDFGETNPDISQNLKYGNNIIKTTKYNPLTLVPKNLFYQFNRASNIFFLVVSVLTCMPFSPKEPTSMIGTFVFVLFFTMMKDAIEDLGRYKQDRRSNNHPVLKFQNGEWKEDKCYKLYPGDIIKVNREEEVTCDIVAIYSSNEGGYFYLDTKNLDGETNLKEKCSIEDLKQFKFSPQELSEVKGIIETTDSDANLNEWEGIMTYNNITDIYCCIKNMVLKGCVIKNTDYIFGIVVYTGHHTKIMKNSKHPKPKTSKVVKTMNKILYTLFAFTILICLIFAVFSVKFINNNKGTLTYIFVNENSNDKSTAVNYIQYALIFFIAYAQIIPISLYVVMEMIKMFQGVLIKYDSDIFDINLNKPATCRASELIEELGQVDFIFSDKTGTLTQNVMVFKKCYINGKVYGAENEVNCEDLKTTINGDYAAYNLLKRKNYNEEENVDRNMVEKFFLLLSLCHEVFPEIKDNGVITYQGASPDDIALVKGAQQLGIEFVSKDYNKIKLQNHITGETLYYEMLCVIPFDSDRKRMSVLVRDSETQKIILFSKGSDGIMLQGVPPHKAIITTYDNAGNTKANACKILDAFSKEGLRILAMGYKEIDQEFYDKWIKKHDEARKKSEEILKMIYNEIECDLHFLGCSAIEDKLQDGVPEAMEVLISCGIRIWVLTGDKQDTAEQIGRQCRLIDQSMKLINLSCESGNKVEVTEKLLRLGDEFDVMGFLGNNKIDLEKVMHNLEDNGIFLSTSIIIDGVTLQSILDDNDLSKIFFLVCCVSKTVICCRVTPKQKSEVVRLAKTSGDYVTLSIGDGANDVPMLLEASIGVGIQGKEGTQAVRSADYAIGQFRYLEKLILFYGRNGYIKISKFICYYFYKNIILVVTELFMAFYNGFSGQVFFADWLGTMFNAIFTSWPCLFTFAYEKQHSVLLCKRFPSLYKAGPKNILFNMKVFWTYVIYGFLHSALCFYIPVFGMRGYTSKNGTVMNHWRVSTVSFCLVIHVVSIKLMIISDFWNVLTILFSFISVAFYYAILICLCTNFFGSIFQNEVIGVFEDIIKDGKSICMIILAPFVICFPDICDKMIFYTFFPNPSEYLYKFRNSVEVRKIIENNNRRSLIQKSLIAYKLSRSITNTTKKIDDNEHRKLNEERENTTNIPLKEPHLGNIIEKLNKNNSVSPNSKSKSLNRFEEKKLKMKALSLYPEMLKKGYLCGIDFEAPAENPNEVNESRNTYQGKNKRNYKSEYGEVSVSSGNSKSSSIRIVN